MTKRIYTPGFNESPHFINPFKGFKIGDRVWFKRYDSDSVYIGYVYAFPRTCYNDPDLRMAVTARFGDSQPGNFIGSVVISCLTNDYHQWYINELEYLEEYITA